MSTTCDIEFSNSPQKVVYAGETLLGIVHLTLTEEETVRGVYIRIKGDAYACWNRNRLHLGQNRKIYSGQEVYYDEKIYLVGSEIGEVQLAPGIYHYPFECVLPPGMPSSVETECGHVRCSATVVMDIPMWPDKTFKEIFTVIKYINLNDDQHLREPVRAEIRKIFTTFCFSSEPLKIVVRVPVRGYTPGQSINLIIYVQNRSRVAVSDFLVELIQQFTYNTVNNSHKNVREWSIADVSTDGCEYLRDRIIRTNLEIPPVPPTDCQSSNIILVEYVIRITASVGLFHFNPVLEIPITIGSIPIRDEIPSQAISSSESTALITRFDEAIQTPTAPLASIPIQDGTPSQAINSNGNTLPSARSTDTMLESTTPPPDYDNPPTYEEVIYNIRRVYFNRGEHFKPKYPMFRRKTSYSIGNEDRS